MSQELILKEKSNVFNNPQNQRLLSPRSLARKPDLANFNKKKPTQISQIRSSDRIRFISPTKANLFVSDESINTNNPVEFSYTQYSSNQNINYPFIKKCASPKHSDNNLMKQISPKSSFSHKKESSETSFLSSFIQPSVGQFSNFFIELSSEINHDNQGSKPSINEKNKKKLSLQQQIQELKKGNLQLNLLILQKNETIERRKQQYDQKIAQLTRQLSEVKLQRETSQQKFTKIQQKLSSYRLRVDQLQSRLSETIIKLEKAQKEIKMYKAKFKPILNNSNLIKEKDEPKCRKYHQNCCGRKQEQYFSSKSIKNQQNIFSSGLKHTNISNNNNILRQSKKLNNQNNSNFNDSQVISSITSSSSELIKKIKSEKILPVWQSQINTSLQTECLMRIHHNQQQFSEFLQLKIQIQRLKKEIQYKDIEINTLKRVKCDFQREKDNYEKVKKFNKKLLAKVEALTNHQGGQKRHQNRQQTTPKKKRPTPSLYSDDFKDNTQEKSLNNHLSQSDCVEFQLSPQKQQHPSQSQSQNQNESQNEQDETLLIDGIKMY